MTVESITTEAEALLGKLANLGRAARNHGAELRPRCRLAHRQVEEAYVQAQAAGKHEEAADLAAIAATLEGWLEVLA